MSFSSALIFLLHLAFLPNPTNNPFENARLQAVEVASEASFRGLMIAPTGDVWIGGTSGTVIHFDGQDWTIMQVPGAEKLDFRDIWAFDGLRVVAMSAGPEKDSRIYRSEDGGKSWQEVFVNPYPDGFFDGLSFINQRKGFTYSDPVGGKLLIMTTDDGGSSWRALDKQKLPPTLHGEASFAASGTGIISIGKNIWISTGGAEKARVFLSQDEGSSWEVVDTPMRAGAPAAGIFSMAFYDRRNGVAVGGHYQKPKEQEKSAIITSDGGRTWRLAKTMPRGYRCGVSFVPGYPNALLAVGTTGTDISLDGGDTWQEFNNINLNAIKFGRSIDQGWAVGPVGRIMRFIPDSQP